MALIGGVGKAAFKLLIPEYIKKGYNATKALAYFRNVLKGQVRDVYAYDAFREVSHKKIKEDLWRTQSIFEPIKRSLIIDRDLAGDRLYRMSAYLQVKDDVSGEVYDRFITIYTDEMETPEDPLRIWDEQRDKENSRTRVLWDSVIVTELLRNKNKL